MGSLESETLSYLVAAIILFGTPFAAFFLWAAWKTRHEGNKSLAASDSQYLEQHGQLAFDSMLKERAAIKGRNPLSRAINSPLAGTLYSTLDHEQLAELIKINLDKAKIGNPPHRLSPSSLEPNEMLLSAEWQYPKNPKLTTLVYLELKIEPSSPSGSSCQYKYRIVPEDDPFAAQIVELTNIWLNNLAKVRNPYRP